MRVRDICSMLAWFLGLFMFCMRVARFYLYRVGTSIADLMLSLITKRMRGACAISNDDELITLLQPTPKQICDTLDDEVFGRCGQCVDRLTATVLDKRCLLCCRRTVVLPHTYDEDDQMLVRIHPKCATFQLVRAMLMYCLLCVGFWEGSQPSKLICCLFRAKTADLSDALSSLPD